MILFCTQFIVSFLPLFFLYLRVFSVGCQHAGSLVQIRGKIWRRTMSSHSRCGKVGEGWRSTFCQFQFFYGRIEYSPQKRSWRQLKINIQGTPNSLINICTIFWLYLDKTIVQTLPGSSVPYTLNKYKEDLGKPFSKLYFWLCRTSDIPSCIPLKRGLRAVSQDNQTFQILPRQLIQKRTKEMAPQEYHAAKLRQVRQLMEL